MTGPKDTLAVRADWLEVKKHERVNQIRKMSEKRSREYGYLDESESLQKYIRIEPVYFESVEFEFADKDLNFTATATEKSFAMQCINKPPYPTPPHPISAGAYTGIQLKAVRNSTRSLAWDKVKKLADYFELSVSADDRARLADSKTPTPEGLIEIFRELWQRNFAKQEDAAEDTAATREKAERYLDEWARREYFYREISLLEESRRFHPFAFSDLKAGLEAGDPAALDAYKRGVRTSAEKMKDFISKRSIVRPT
ncbi:hypothetical protein QBC46DRAFT_345491 [Diplogelasinospora grovesii]|uniref:Uncharacterized protein n=1 Tax=Diplogelasinospora grovesii TaxID=303347 RepID=A0AAN6N0Y8_9PEZI|nr:hypothetical protein QBC46DRAFT_345491 [Diplogelasinospora grovesii]